MAISRWEPKRTTEEAYRKAIKLAMHKIGESLIGLEDPADVLRTLFNATKEPWFMEYSKAAAMQMVTRAFSETGRTWREAFSKSRRAKVMYAELMKEMQGPLGITMRELIERNASFITSVPDSIAREMTQKIMEAQMSGFRASDIAQGLMDLYPHISTVKANLIARTEAAKTSSNLVQARSQILGIDWYKWQTSEDGRVRESHRKMDQVLVCWNDPPSPETLVHEHSVGNYHAGNIWQCRCYPEPLVDLDLVDWPAKVYRHGRIVTMTRAKFEQFTGNRETAHR